MDEQRLNYQLEPIYSNSGADTGCSLEDQPGAMDYKDEWRKRVREIHASSTTY